MKRLLVILLVVALIPTFFGCSKELSPKKALQLVNENSFMSFPLKTLESELEPTNFTREEGEPGYKLYRDERTFVQVSGNPPSDSVMMVTRFSTTSPRYNVLGIEVDSAFSDAYYTLMDYGFGEPTVIGGTFMQSRGGDIIIDVYGNDVGEVTKVEVYFTFYRDYLVIPTAAPES
ncbi:MAG: hypothetical protein GX802_01155 [Clostridiales bacterium]|nr:hypothetical protein [Clostridiales bacterium]